MVHLLDDPYRLVPPRTHPLASRRVVGLAELAEEAWVGNEWPPGQCAQVVLDACAAAGFSPGIVVEPENYACAQRFVAASPGLCLVPLLGVEHRRPGVVVRRVRRPEPVRVIHAVVRESIADQPVARCLLDALPRGGVRRR
ncbi:MAG TPA: LysR substrate-binding domain-containing protein [Actinophytocola sp.]|nr:LysR substrate-binding domain-containing protein [Actinophytocola sp.]